MDTTGWKNFAAIAIASAIIISTLIGCHGRPTIDRSAATETKHPAAEAEIAAPGVVEPWAGEVRLATTETGVLSELLVVEGQTVKKGQLVARIEDTQQRHAVDIAEAELRQAAAVVVGLASTPGEVRAAEADLEAATARAQQRRRDQRRAESLGESGALARAEVEGAVSSAHIDAAAAEAARARFLLAKRGARLSDRQIARARLEAAEARRADARTALARREVRAPLDGVVMSSRYHVGELYAPSQGPLMVLGDLERLQVRLEVDDGDAVELVPGATCQLRGDGGEPLGDGTLARVAVEYGSRGLAIERPTARADARVREAFVAARPSKLLAPGQRVWGYCARGSLHASR